MASCGLPEEKAFDDHSWDTERRLTKRAKLEEIKSIADIVISTKDRCVNIYEKVKQQADRLQKDTLESYNKAGLAVEASIEAREMSQKATKTFDRCVSVYENVIYDAKHCMAIKENCERIQSNIETRLGNEPHSCQPAEVSMLAMAPIMPVVTKQQFETYRDQHFFLFGNTNQLELVLAQSEMMGRPVLFNNPVDEKYHAIINDLASKATQFKMKQKMDGFQSSEWPDWYKTKRDQYSHSYGGGMLGSNQQVIMQTLPFSVKYDLHKQLSEGIIDCQQLLRFGFHEDIEVIIKLNPGEPYDVYAAKLKGGFITLFGFLINLALCSRKLTAAAAFAVYQNPRKTHANKYDLTYSFQEHFNK